ncbi:class I SAM-dependent methyltransferase [Flavobacteriaceae bacterium F08102]|nr:class I SAM-dependent methyltransferase [Flavobacteriaceae bacterium F08102]
MKSKTITCIDHSVSKESFTLVYNEVLSLYKTDPVPKDLASYYESDEYISHTDSKKTIIEFIYQTVRRVTLRQKLRLINRVAIQKSVLDIGCGTGDFIKVCENAGWNAVGIEPHEGARKIAQNKCNGTVHASIEHIETQFDVVTMWHVLEHVVDLEYYLEQLTRLVKPKGSLIIAVPNYRSDDAKHYGAYWAAYDVPRHVWHFSQESIQQLFKERPFTLVETRGMKFDAFYVSLLSEKYKNGKGNFLNAFWQGFRSNWRARRSSEYSSLIYVLKKI